jgi:hypothetical protein
MNAEAKQSGNPYQHILSLYWQVAPAALRDVLDQIRTALTQLVAELRAGMSNEDDVPSAEAADQAVSVIVTGERSHVHVNTAQASGSATVNSPAPPAESRILDPLAQDWRACCGRGHHRGDRRRGPPSRLGRLRSPKLPSVLVGYSYSAPGPTRPLAPDLVAERPRPRSRGVGVKPGPGPRRSRFFGLTAGRLAAVCHCTLRSRRRPRQRG